MDAQLLQAATENFSLPHDVVSLPSNGVFYKSKKKAVKVGYLTANDENIIINAAMNVQDNLVLTLLRNKLYEHDLRPEELLEGDVEAIMIFLRNTSFGSEYDVNVEDPKTGKMFEASISLDELNIKQTEYKPNEEGLYITKLPKSQVEVKLKPLSYSEIVEIDRMANEYPAGRVAPKITWRLTKQVVELNGSRDKGVIAKFVDQMPISDSKHIRNFLRENQPGLDLKKTVKAPSGEIVTIDVTFGADFFRPFF
jgi:hypothetical protein